MSYQLTHSQFETALRVLAAWWSMSDSVLPADAVLRCALARFGA
jgi:hypothetical protein